MTVLNDGQLDLGRSKVIERMKKEKPRLPSAMYDWPCEEMSAMSVRVGAREATDSRARAG